MCVWVCEREREREREREKKKKTRSDITWEKIENFWGSRLSSLKFLFLPWASFVLVDDNDMNSL